MAGGGSGLYVFWGGGRGTSSLLFTWPLSGLSLARALSPLSLKMYVFFVCIDREGDRKKDRQMDRQIGRQTDRQTDRQREIERERETKAHRWIERQT